MPLKDKEGAGAGKRKLAGSKLKITNIGKLTVAKIKGWAEKNSDVEDVISVHVNSKKKCATIKVASKGGALKLGTAIDDASISGQLVKTSDA